MQPPKILKTKDIAPLLNCTRQTIRNMLRDGRCPIPPIVGSKPPRWLLADVEAFLNGGKQQ